MEVIRKRRASSEVQELMAAVKTEYEFFASFDSMFEPPLFPAKRQRSLSDNVLLKYGVGRNTEFTDLTSSTNKNKGKRNVCCTGQPSSTKTADLVKAAKITPQSPPLPLPKTSTVPSLVSPQKSSSKSHFQFGRIQFSTRLPRVGPGPQPASRPQQTTPADFISESSRPTMAKDGTAESRQGRMIWKQGLEKGPIKHAFEKTTPRLMETLAEENTNDVPLVIPKKVSLEKDRIQEVPTCKPSDENKPAQLTTKIIYGGLSLNATSIYDEPTEAGRTNIEEQQPIQKSKRLSSLENWVSPGKELPLGEFPKSRSADEILIVEDEILGKKSTHRRESEESIDASHSSRKHTFIEDSEVDNFPPNEKEADKSSQQVMSVARASEGERSPKLTDYEIWPNYVITRVSSLLWLGKDMVYPITLNEIRRRVQDPENFSFQMLIAYVRHSRAKGRQFLNYWKCQPTGKTSRPNVLSKLCEADAMELVDGIQKVNEEYFPGEKLARNAAENFFEDLRQTTTGDMAGQMVPQELSVRGKVESIEKSR